MIDFTIHPDGGEPYEVKATARDVLMWEKGGRDRSVLKLLTDLHMSWLYQVAHISSKRTQQFTGTLDEFEKTCELAFEAEEPPDPTRSAPSTED